ncbi:MAG TPA: SDR family oxidoreductase [Candidatus Baltobacteraceae bacterium]|jgi:nucleoside-diphosphate-sugar epimerase|nr:SDR family oxidoreductase [Candidatus Baltobacteraceae bacterium]
MKEKRIFVTGATGFIGSAIVKELIGEGHDVLGLARSDAGAQALAASGAQVHRGSVEDLDSLQRAAEACDGVIHTAFNHDFSKWKENSENDRHAIETLGAVLAGSDRRLVITSGTAIATSPGRIGTEETKITISSTEVPRVASEEAADAIASLGADVSVVRLSPTVHGKGDHGFVPMLIKLARDKGVSAYIGDGQNRWSAVHRIDAAKLFVLALEKGEKSARYHGVAEPGIAFGTIAESIGRGLDVPVKSLSPEEAAEHFGWFAHFAALDAAASSAITRERLGWNPTQPTLLDDLENAGYFEAAVQAV